jgi:hypothetical protein
MVPCARIGIHLRSVHVQEVKPCVEPLSLGPLEVIGVSSLACLCAPFAAPFAGRRGEVSTTPIEWVANRGSLIELLTGGSSGHPCPIR